MYQKEHYGFPLKNHRVFTLFFGPPTDTDPARCVIYIFAIALTQLSEDTTLGQTYFPTLADGM